MQRINTSSAAANLFGAGKSGFQDGNPATATAATFFNAAWCNSVQEEIASVIESVGTTLNSASYTQLLTAINTLIGNRTFASGTRMVFAQASAPTGWTQDVSDDANNRMLRVVNTAGAGVGGSHDPTVNNVVPAHTHGFTTGNESATHTHVDLGHNHINGVYTQLLKPPYAGSLTGFDYNGSGSEQAVGSNDSGSIQTGYASLGTQSSSHNHTGTTDNGSSSTNWTPKYNSVIICIKN